MNKEYIQAGYNFIVSTDSGLKKFERVDNMTKILETENNIEEIQNLKKQNDNEELFSYKNIMDRVEKNFFKKFSSIAILLVFVITILTAIISNFYIGLITMPLSLCGAGLITFLATPFNLHKTHKIIQTISKDADNLLNNELEKQNIKIKELKKESKVLPSNDLGILGERIKINRTQLINDLKRKLELIEEYQFMKKELIEYSEDHFISPKLLDAGYSESDIEFIHQLVENDKSQENEIQKTLIKK